MKAEGVLNSEYFDWLYRLVSPVKHRNSSRSYRSLLMKLHSIPFTWTIPNDDNRAEDGKELRLKYDWHEEIYPIDLDWLTLDCSMLEMLIGLSDRLSFESYGSPGEWFWKLIENLDLIKFTDKSCNAALDREVERIVDVLNNRKYDYSGKGGLFPLNHPKEDQRKIEIWYQMSSYLLEQDYWTS